MAQVKIGTVVSNKMPKTVVVKVDTKVKHRLYKKMITRSKKIKARDELAAKVGQKGKIVETRHYSRRLHFKVMEILN